MKNLSVMIWQNDQVDKILKDKRYSKQSVEELSLNLYKNETESVRFYVTPSKNIRSLRVEVENWWKNLDVSVSHVLYMNVEKSSASTKSDTGWYPDAVVPFSLAEKYGLNFVNAEENQEIHINATTLKETVAGKYQAKVTIFADEDKIVLPLTITVWDYALPNENHTRQYFIINSKHLELVEGNEGFEKYKTYYEQLLQYRVNGSRMPLSLEDDYKTILNNYIINLRRYYANDKISVFNLPVFYTDAYDDVDYMRTEYSFREVIKASIADQVDYFKKAVVYLWILDEPHLTPAKMGYCQTVLPKFELLKNKLIAECLEKQNEKALYSQLAVSLRNIPNILTSGVNGKLLPKEPEAYYITWCPAFDALSQNEGFTQWQTLNKGEKWWYGCNYPVPPYPTYHIDDSYLSPRVLSWIQYAYGITGNLYWSVNYWARKENDVLHYINPYKQSTYERTNGEGMLVYPGGVFGVDGFIPSIRLEAIRDGIEDYESLYCLEKHFNENAQLLGLKSVHVNTVLSPIYSRLFNKTMVVIPSHGVLEKAREIVANMLLGASKYAFTVLDFDKENKRVEFFASNCKIQIDGGDLKNVGNIYTISATNDEVRLILQGRRNERVEICFSFFEIAHPPKYALSDCWAKTVETYEIKDCSPENIVKPYYDILNDKTVKNYAPCCTALGSLISFVWRTETAIVKKRIGNIYQITLIVPKGDFRTAEPFETEILDEQARKYTLTTEKKRVTVEVENDKGTYLAELYVY